MEIEAKYNHRSRQLRNLLLVGFLILGGIITLIACAYMFLVTPN